MIEWAKRESEREEKERLARLTQQEQEDLELAIALSKSELSWGVIFHLPLLLQGSARLGLAQKAPKRSGDCVGLIQQHLLTPWRDFLRINSSLNLCTPFSPGCVHFFHPGLCGFCLKKRNKMEILFWRVDCSGYGFSKCLVLKLSRRLNSLECKLFKRLKVKLHCQRSSVYPLTQTHYTLLNVGFL